MCGVRCFVLYTIHVLCAMYCKGGVSCVLCVMYCKCCVSCALCVLCGTVYPEILAVIKFGDLPEIWPNALLAEFKFGSLPESYVFA